MLPWYNKNIQAGKRQKILEIWPSKAINKKHSWNNNILNNYRFQILHCFSNVIERAVGLYLNIYLIKTNLNELLQSAYKSSQSTETALVREKNYIIMSIDQCKPLILVLLDLSSAFEAVDHIVLFSRLKDIFRLSGKVLEWFQSYLGQRSQSVCSLYFIRYSVFVILCTTEFISWSSSFHHVYPYSWIHCGAIY